MTNIDNQATHSHSTGTNNDWRIDLFGPYIQKNDATSIDEETPVSLIPTKHSLSEKYNHIAIFIGANYCPHCKLFAPQVLASAKYFEQNNCKLLFCSNDRDEENFQASCIKTQGIDVIPYDTNKTRHMRDLFEIKTIPALIVLRNSDFNTTPVPVVNARHILQNDPTLKNFPWSAPQQGDEVTKKIDPPSASMSAWDRFLIQGQYGKWYNIGHLNVGSAGHSSASSPQRYMDEHAVRIRAGILNVITWIALLNIFYFRDLSLVYVLFPLVSFEFITSSLFGLTPIAPVGTAATVLAIILQPHPHWKPANPKRFAWAIGLILASMCFFVVVAVRKELGDAYIPTVAAIVLACNVFTWLESACGFCVGCFVYNTYLVKWFDNLEECDECKL